MRAVTLGLTGLVLTGALGLSACDNPVSGPDAPDPLDSALASVNNLAGLLSGPEAGSKDLNQVHFDDADAPEAYREITAHMTGYDVEVTGEVTSADDQAASARLHWVWDLDGREWAYDSEIALTPTDDDVNAEIVAGQNGSGGGADDWTVTWSPQLVNPDLRAGEVFDVDLVAAKRGDIVGADGPIVTYRPVIRYGLNKAAIPKSKWASSAQQVAEAVGVEADGFKASVKAAGPEAFVVAIVYRKSDAGANVAGNFSDIPGSLAVSDSIPLGPSRTFAAPILGTVGTATAEDAKKSKGTIAEGDEIGTSGLQQSFDAQLRGTAGIRIQAYKAPATKSDQGRERTLVSFKPVTGKDLRISLNSRLQNLGERVLADEDSISALVAIRPSTGALLTIANGAANAGFNTATTGQYPPGSTFKVVSSLALLRHGWTPNTTFACPSTVNVGGRVFKNYGDYPSSGLGTITLTTALANSCNTFFIGSSAKLGDKDLGNAARSLGLITEHDLGFPAYFGQVPVPTSTPVKGANMIGQGMVLSSPLGMATVAASVAKGATVVPWLVATRKDTTEPDDPITGAEAAKIRQMMRTVVTSGTGSVLADLGGDVMAKTGTAEYSTGDGIGTHAWMIAIDGDLAVAVLVEDGESGSHTAGPLMHEFLAGK